MSNSPRHQLPYILPGQAQKEWFHNEALSVIDMLLHAAVETAALAVPPAEPEIGACWIVSSGATGAWTEHEGHLASWSEGGWRFANPRPGSMVWDKAEGRHLCWDSGSWTDSLNVGSISVDGLQVLGQRTSAIPNPSGGTTIDTEARAAITAILVALKSHGLIE